MKLSEAGTPSSNQSYLTGGAPTSLKNTNTS